MNLTKMIAELRLQSGQIADAILSLERLEGCGKRRRGRPPGSKNKHRPLQIVGKTEDAFDNPPSRRAS